MTDTDLVHKGSFVSFFDADTARIIGTNGGNIAKTDAIKEQLRRGVSSRTPAAPGTPTRMSK